MEHNHEAQKPETSAPSEFWLGLDDYNNDPAFRKMAEGEFITSPLKEDDAKDGLARREFLKLMGASLAMASASCVRRPVQTIIPYAQAPKEITPGEPTWYTSTYYDGQQGYGLLVKTLDGRPIKVEGNPNHPMNSGSLTVPAHAEVLALYDPDRLQNPRRNLLNKERTNRETINSTFEAADAKLAPLFAKGPLVVLTESTPSPSTRSIIADFLRVYPGQHIQMDSMPAADVREAQRRSYGRDVMPRYRFDRAKMIVSIEADFLGTYLSPAEFMRQWAKGRTPGKEMSRMVMFESLMSVTGMNADDRIRIKPSQQLDVALGLLVEVAKRAGRSFAFAAQYANVAQNLNIDPALFSRTADELWKNRGQGLVIAGGLTAQTQEAVELQMAVNMLNSVLDNDGKTVDYDAAPYEGFRSNYAEITKLIADMNAGKVGSIIIHGVNPLYTLPTELGFAEALKKVETVVYTGNYNDETGFAAQYVLPAGLNFESWGDYELQAGVYSIQQPTIRPLYATRSFQESLFTWAKAANNAPAKVKGVETWYEYVRSVWREEVFPKAPGAMRGAGFDEFWVNMLQVGVVDTATGRRDSTAGARTASADFANTKRAAAQGLELVLYPKVGIMDGRFANIPWLQELPDPVTKIVWDNYLCVSPSLAEGEKLREGDLVTLTVGNKSVEVPVHIQPGQHDAVLGLAVGYGRQGVGKVAKGLGANAYKLANVANGRPVYSGLAASIKKTGGRYELACVQGHHQLEGRPIAGYTTNANFQKNPDSGLNKPHVFSIWPEHKYTKNKWGMAIDMNVCTGCSACVIACQSENNVPTVGKKYILQGREMHWLRIDRYYTGEPSSPDVVMQPMLCQHCETAPCETVCPVLATVHNEEGLNDMIYNRCVGTRYCSNNCPYKVRRFNWFNYSNRPKPTHMQLNPDVTVRSRGVMEKCTFCVQRIRRGTNVAKDQKRPLRDGEIRTACEETCPTNAIVFGDLNDPESRVAQLFKKNERMYGVLEELNTVPRVRYQSRIRNADREIKEFPKLPETHGAPGEHA